MNTQKIMADFQYFIELLNKLITKSIFLRTKKGRLNIKTQRFFETAPEINYIK
ncbi:hypothetical protein SAMN05444280_114102 [Tangfeifania diversioriginum]|uniref:Uncharacterized protein n=1 Tax=Tangfeifania diversioriginum TaxID=1168035 RepID=A0A1M6HV99_9BACT|nr:hypothetical protein SAMN05444280_114102 [Tangfeifania diversioriginum]